MEAAEVRELASALDAAAAVGPVWSDYTIANHPVVFVSQSRDTAAAACAAIWRYRETLEVIPMSRGIRLSTPLYAMWNVDPVGPNPRSGNSAVVSTLRPVPRELEDALRARGDTRAIVVPAPLRYEDLGALGASLRAMNIRATPMLAQLAIHESYHLHSQFPAWLDQPRRYDWPAWDVQPDRKMLVQKCYGGTPAVADVHRRELAALEQAWLLLMGQRDTVTDAAARDSAVAFMSARRDRYALLEGVTIPSPVGPITCDRAEDVMELEEGAPQWIGYVTAFRAGLIRVEEVGRRGAEAFYASGTFQLWILERLLGPSAMRTLTAGITRSTGPGGENGAIFARFGSVVSRGLPAAPAVTAQAAGVDNLVVPASAERTPSGTLGHVEVLGRGPVPLILIPGAPFTWRVWAGFAARNADRYTMYGITLPGYGGTPVPVARDDSVEKREWTLGVVLALEELVETRRLQRPVIIANHLMAAYYAVLLAGRLECRIGGIVAIASDPISGDPLQYAMLPNREERRRSLRERWMPFYRSLDSASWFRGAYGPRALSDDPARAAALYREQMAPPLYAQARYYLEYVSDDISETLQRLRVPMLSVVTRFDASLLPDKALQSLVARWGDHETVRDSLSRTAFWQHRFGLRVPSLSVEYVKNTGAVMMDDDPDLIDRLVADFVAARRDCR